MISKPPSVTVRGYPRAQSGIALLTALFVVALATIAAVALVSSSSIALRRTENLIDSERAWWYADGAESWVKSILAEDAKSKTNGAPDALGDAWAQPIAFLPIDQGGIRGRIVDLQGLFNLNNFGVTAPNQLQLVTQQFQRLLENIPEIDTFTAEGLGPAIIDWIDTNDERNGATGAEDGDYLSLDPPYRAANQPFHSVTELMAIRGMTADLYTKLLPYVCALPVTNTPGTPVQLTNININTAPLPVLMSLAPGIDAQKLQDFTQTRIESPVDSAKATATAQAWVVQASPPKLNVQATSEYFELQAEVVVGSAHVALYSVIHRPPGGGNNAPPPVVIAHSTDTE